MTEVTFASGRVPARQYGSMLYHQAAQQFASDFQQEESKRFAVLV